MIIPENALFTVEQFNNAKSREICLDMRCENCGKVFKVSRHTVRRILNPNANATGKYCTNKCNAKSKDTKTIVSCGNCSRNFYRRSSEIIPGVENYCCSSCAAQINNSKFPKRKSNSPYKSFRWSCDFKFQPEDHPNLPGYDLISKVGWYSTGRNNRNLTGCTKDHMVSVREAWERKYNPYYISHVMNCQILLHVDNVKKHSKSQMSYEELVSKCVEYDMLNKNLLTIE